MRIRALVYTSVGQPEKPLLDQAWDIELAERNDKDIRRALEDLLIADDTHNAAVVDLDIPDDPLLQRLVRGKPPIPGTVA